MSQHLKESVLKSLEKVRPYLISDGGDIELVGINGENIVNVRFTGSCSECPHKYQTFAGIQEVILKDSPEIKEVIDVDDRK